MRALGLALRGSKMTSSTLMWLNRSSRASSSTGSIRFTSNLLHASTSPQRRLPGRGPVRGLVRPQLGRHGERLGRMSRLPAAVAGARGGGAAGLGGPTALVPRAERRRGHPRLERRLVPPAGDDEPGGPVVDGAEELEALEAVLLVDGAGAGGEATPELVARLGRDGDGVDLDDRHAAEDATPTPPPTPRFRPVSVPRTGGMPRRPRSTGRGRSPRRGPGGPGTCGRPRRGRPGRRRATTGATGAPPVRP